MARKKRHNPVIPFHADEIVTLNLTGDQANLLLCTIESPHALQERGVWCDTTEKTWRSIGHYLRYIHEHSEPVFPEGPLPF